MLNGSFEIGDQVYAGDWCYGQIIDISFENREALVEFDTESGGGSLWFEFGGVNKSFYERRNDIYEESYIF